MPELSKKLLEEMNVQIQEELNTDALVQKLKMLGQDKNALYLLDKEVATRVFTPPVCLTY